MDVLPTLGEPRITILRLRGALAISETGVDGWEL
jgi:hypothetical protein